MTDSDQMERNRQAILHLSRACLRLAAVVGDMEARGHGSANRVAALHVDDPGRFIHEAMTSIQTAVQMLEQE